MSVPSAFRWPEAYGTGRSARIRSRIKRFTGFDLLPDDRVAAEYARLLNTGDPVAERFVDETFLGPVGPERSREMLNQALDRGVDGVPDAPAS